MRSNFFEKIRKLSRNDFLKLRQELRQQGGDAYYFLISDPSAVSELKKEEIAAIFTKHGISDIDAATVSDAAKAVMARAVTLN